MTTLYRNPDNSGLLRAAGGIAKHTDCCCAPSCWDCRRIWPDELELVVTGWTGPESSAMNGTFVLTKQDAEGDYRTLCWYRVFIDPLWVGTGPGGYSPSSVNGYAVEIGDLGGVGHYAQVWPMSELASPFETDPTWGSPCMTGYAFSSLVPKRCTELVALNCTGGGGSITKVGVSTTWATSPTSVTLSSL